MRMILQHHHQTYRYFCGLLISNLKRRTGSLNRRYHHLLIRFAIVRLVEEASFLPYWEVVAFLLVGEASCLEVEAFHLEGVANHLLVDFINQISKPSL